MNELDIYAHIINDLNKNNRGDVYYVITVKLVKKRSDLLWLYDHHSFRLFSMEEVRRYLRESIYPAIDIVTSSFFGDSKFTPLGGKYYFPFTHKHAKMLGIEDYYETAKPVDQE